MSSDGGSYGGAGAERFASTSPLAQSAIAVVVLDGLGGRGRPRLAIAGDEPLSPARALVRTAAARVEEQVGTSPSLPSIPTQLADLGIPFAYGEQGRFLGHRIAAVTLTTATPGGAANPAGDLDTGLAVRRLGQLGRATEALLSSLDRSLGGPFRTPDSVFFADRAASGWAVRLTLVLAVVPFALGLVDLIVRGRRRGLPFRPALRALRTRLVVALLGGLLVWIGALGGAFPTGAALPLSPFTETLDNPSVGGILLLLGALVIGWLVARRRLVPGRPTTAEERLAGLASALAAVAIVAVVLAIAKPYALVFVLPSLYAWLWLPTERRLWQRAVLFSVGLAGPILGLVVLANELGVPIPRAALYAVGLVTVGYVPFSSALLGLVWPQQPRRSRRSHSGATRRMRTASSPHLRGRFARSCVGVSSRARENGRRRRPESRPRRAERGRERRRTPPARSCATPDP